MKRVFTGKEMHELIEKAEWNTEKDRESVHGFIKRMEQNEGDYFALSVMHCNECGKTMFAIQSVPASMPCICRKCGCEAAYIMASSMYKDDLTEYYDEIDGFL